MKKSKLLAVLLALAMTLSLLPTTALAGVPKAVIGNAGYATLQDAINAAPEDTQTTVYLQADTAENINIPAGKDIWLCLYGNVTLSDDGGDTISNHGKLTIESGEGTGTVDNKTHGKGALVNYPGGEVTILNCTLTRSLESASNSWYTIKNMGTMKIDSDHATVTNGNNATGSSSLIANGWYGNAAKDRNTTYTDTSATLTIKDGTFRYGMNTVKNDDFGVLNISGGTFTNTFGPTILNWNETTITGGTFESSSYVLANGYLNDAGDKGQFTIQGGSFKAGNGESPLFGYGVGTATGGTLSISGGNFKGQVNGDLP